MTLIEPDEEAARGLVTATQYADHRKAAGLPGGSHKAVYKALDSGRCPVAGYRKTLKGGKGAALIHPPTANAAWSSTSLAPVGSATAPAGDADLEHDYNASRAKHEHEKAAIAEMKRLEMEGELRRRSDVEAEWTELAALTKAAVLGTSPTLASAIVTRFELPDDVVGPMQAMIDAQLRTALVSLGDE